MHLVHGAVDAHGCAQAVGSPVLLQATQDATQRGSDQIGRAEGHDGAHVLHGHTVLFRGLHSQPGQDFHTLLQSFFSPAVRVRIFFIFPALGCRVANVEWHDCHSLFDGRDVFGLNLAFG